MTKMNAMIKAKEILIFWIWAGRVAGFHIPSAQPAKPSLKVMKENSLKKLNMKLEIFFYFLKEKKNLPIFPRPWPVKGGFQNLTHLTHQLLAWCVRNRPTPASRTLTGLYRIKPVFETSVSQLTGEFKT